MELEDYGLTVRALSAYSSDKISPKRLLDLPLPYPGHACSFGVEINEELSLMATFSHITNETDTFFVKVSLWKEGGTHLTSDSFSHMKVSSKDIRPAMFTIAAPLVDKYRTHLSESFCTHFDRLAQHLKNTPK